MWGWGLKAGGGTKVVEVGGGKKSDRKEGRREKREEVSSLGNKSGWKQNGRGD